MARKMKITYVCDGCGKTVPSVRDLQGFSIVKRGRGRAKDDWTNVDLCDECEGRFLMAVEPIIGSEVLAYRRTDVEAV